MTTEPGPPRHCPAPQPLPASRERQAALYKRAMKTLPGGTNSNFRAWGEDTVYIDRGKGGTIWDIDRTSTSTSGWATAR